MAYVAADRVLESTTTTGTGDLTVAGALAGFRAFGAVMSVGDTAHCALWAVDASGNATGDYEEGLYTYSASNTLTRTEVIDSSTGSVLNLAAGTKYVAISLLAPRIFTSGQGRALAYGAFSP